MKGKADKLSKMGATTLKATTEKASRGRGRPSLGAEALTVTYPIRLSKKMLQRIRKHANRGEGGTVAARRLIQERLDQLDQ